MGTLRKYGTNVINWLENPNTDRRVVPGIGLTNVVYAWHSVGETGTLNWIKFPVSGSWQQYYHLSGFPDDTHPHKVYQNRGYATITNNGTEYIYGEMSELSQFKERPSFNTYNSGTPPVGSIVFFVDGRFVTPQWLQSQGAFPFELSTPYDLKKNMLLATPWIKTCIALQAFEKNYVWITNDHLVDPKVYLKPSNPFTTPPTFPTTDTNWRWIKVSRASLRSLGFREQGWTGRLWYNPNNYKITDPPLEWFPNGNYDYTVRGDQPELRQLIDLGVGIYPVIGEEPENPDDPFPSESPFPKNIAAHKVNVRPQ